MSADEGRRRIDEEIYRLRCEVQECAHCQSLRNQMIRLIEIRVPDPIVLRREQISEFLLERAKADKPQG